MRFLQIISKSNTKIAKKYLYEYIHELSEFDDTIQFDKNNNPIYKWFDSYWTDKDRYPFFLLIDNQIAGFAFIRELELDKYEIAEFYVCKQFRKDGNAIWFADNVINLFEGEFDFSAHNQNKRAINFWNKFVKKFEYSNCIKNGKYHCWTIKNKNKR